MINRSQIEFANNRLFKGKALIIFGPRQTGKTTFVELLLENVEKLVLRLNGDESDLRELLSNVNSATLRNIIGSNEIVFIDEAQRIPGIGLTIKIITDQLKDVQVIATGSSSFELAKHIHEPLTGRKYEMLLLPLSWQELVTHTDFLSERRALEQRLVYGSYPEIVLDNERAAEHLKLIANSYLYKDLFELEQVKKPMLFEKLVKALALQVGSEVSINEISGSLQADNKTVEKYIAMLEKAFVIFTVSAFSRNVRNELKKSRKIYFYDNGIRNAVIGNLNRISQRTDVGPLWENYLMSERRKRLNIQQSDAQMHFWRTTQQQEIDYIETNSNQISAFEFKWKPKAKQKFPTTFVKAYPEARLQQVNPENYHEFFQ